MEIFFGFISAAFDRRPGGRWRRSRSLTTLVRVKSHSFPRQTTSTAPFSTAASCPPPFPFCRRPTLPLPFLPQAQSFILSLSVCSCHNLYFPISFFLCFSLFYSECHHTQEIKNANAKLELHLHAFSCCFGIWNVFVLYFIFTFNTSNPLFDQHTAFVFRQSCNVLVPPKQHTDHFFSRTR